MRRQSVLLLWLLLTALPFSSSDQAAGPEYWYAEARTQLHRALHSPPQGGVAKNVVLVVGDGMSLATVTAARILRGQQLGMSGEEHQLAFEKFPHLALAKTYNNDAQIGDSSACATALLCGVKANTETLGLDAGARFEDCRSSHTHRVSSIFDWAQKEGKSTGIVTNTRITHGTPAALYAHSASRYWEDDSKIPPGARKTCKDIVRQLVEDEPGRNINVILGGGRRHFMPKVARDPEVDTEEGRRLDGRNLIDDWSRDKKKRNIRAQYVWNKGQFDNVDPANVDHLLGLFSYSHLDFEVDRDNSANGDPSLANMTRKAIEVLQKNPHGFFLFIEGGRIDHAHHYNNARRALEETLAMETALQAAMTMLDPSNTLFVVTSDHSHVMTLGGFGTKRGNPILGTDIKPSDVDQMPYTTLLYGNGPGFGRHPVSGKRDNMTGSDPLDKNYVQQAAVPRQWATHGGEDVPVYAQGPMAHAFRGVIDQTFIPHAIAYAACVGSQKDRCSEPQKDAACPTDPAAAASSSAADRKENVSTPHAQRPALTVEAAAAASAAPAASIAMALVLLAATLAACTS
ncbi:alkaline phosphatase, tissue-nonspecific isozyme-like isoform X1 [Neocloeon triangulifer]|uniref:alkaline phosphatase, tissue-nonspecific isozyme-like isoform X1 n=2 Tax=Neocloeon triangulifer TaxID=2078957 RepID=UPI00286F1F02|nr:alkaline phosphatase, tissue-nonspecific isozyme-like isoform X1 [Neocloeon triangulifer]